MHLQTSNYSVNFETIKGLVICEVLRSGGVLLAELCVKVYLKTSHFAEKGESQVFKRRQVDHVLPYRVLPSAMS